MHPMAVLGDPVRRALIADLAGGERTAGALARGAHAAFGIGGPAVSQHLAVLKAHGFARVRPRGRERVYRLAPDGFAAAEHWLLAWRPFWEAAFDRLGDELDRAADQA